MTLTAAGRLGIGTTSPNEALDVAGNINTSDNIQTTGNRYIYSSAGGSLGAVRSGLLLDGGSQALVFLTAAAERARINSSGQLLVGSTSTVASGSETAGFKGTVGISARSTGGASAFAGSFWNDSTSGDNVFLRFYTEASGTERGAISYNRAGGLVVYGTTSDYRAKDISGPVIGSGEIIDSVPVYMGKMKGATQERPMFIAHETPEYAHTGEKDAVDEDGNPVYQQMDASALIPVMWAEIQSLRKRLADAGIA
jgi:hypothetical protein